MIRSVIATTVLLLVTASTPAADPPRVVRENIEWLDVWVPGNNVKDQCRVLLIGDSITRGYYKTVEDKLNGKAVVCRLTTSKSLGDPALLDEVKLVLGQAKFDLVHFNNGMHGWGYSEEEYAKGLPDLVATIRKGAPGAQLIWATTTPVRVSGKVDQFDPKTDRVKARNKAAADAMKKEMIQTNDLFSLVVEKPDWFSQDGVHLNAKGSTAMGEQVATSVLNLLGQGEK
ncbi:MAG TPA: SGNH/GDSL hydrolase family protein [Gemmata sp.]|jgi:lysophospholipase L1-like esterase|nr:SGNH/GDSL hydrolase family protein [Gemmata sp.]